MGAQFAIGINTAGQISVTPLVLNKKETVTFVESKLNKLVTKKKATAQEIVQSAAQSNYTFTPEQIEALAPVYRWSYPPNGAQLLSVHDKMHANYGWVRASVQPDGFAYKKKVNDSAPVVLHQLPVRMGGQYVYNYGPGVEQFEAALINSAYFWMPTKGPFSVIFANPQATWQGCIHAFC